MNRVFLSGRMVRDPEIRQSGDMSIAKFTIAVDRRSKKGEEKQSDFINCTAFGNQATFIEKYFKKGNGINIEGRIQTGSYTNKDGQKVFTTDVIIDAVEFPLSNGTNGQKQSAPKQDDNGFMNIPDGIDELPFN